MIGIEREAVVADVASITVPIGRPFAIVAVAAKRLQGPKPELVQSPLCGGLWSAMVAGMIRPCRLQSLHNGSIIS
jgi:hypothetical protein